LGEDFRDGSFRDTPQVLLSVTLFYDAAQAAFSVTLSATVFRDAPQVLLSLTLFHDAV